jgi:hypothetical protein
LGGWIWSAAVASRQEGENLLKLKRVYTGGRRGRAGARWNLGLLWGTGLSAFRAAVRALSATAKKPLYVLDELP